MKPDPAPEDWAGKLIRLKRYETPGEVYFENFLDEFRERQRSEALRLSVVTLAMDRLLTWWRGVPLSGRLAAAVAVGALCAVPVLVLQPWSRGPVLHTAQEAAAVGKLPELAEVSLVREF